MFTYEDIQTLIAQQNAIHLKNSVWHPLNTIERHVRLYVYR